MCVCVCARARARARVYVCMSVRVRVCVYVCVTGHLLEIQTAQHTQSSGSGGSRRNPTVAKSMVLSDTRPKQW